jgi:hypothetical protein
MSEQGNTTGGCQCGAVRFELAQAPAEYGACHCSICRKVGGGVALSAMVHPGGATWTSSASLKTFASSEWAERGFCGECGSSLFWRLSAPGPMQGLMYLSVGALDDMGDMPMTSEVFIDHKPDSYDFAGERQRLTQAEVMAMVAGDG